MQARRPQICCSVSPMLRSLLHPLLRGGRYHREDNVFLQPCCDMFTPYNICTFVCIIHRHWLIHVSKVILVLKYDAIVSTSLGKMLNVPVNSVPTSLQQIVHHSAATCPDVYGKMPVIPAATYPIIWRQYVPASRSKNSQHPKAICFIILRQHVPTF